MTLGFNLSHYHFMPVAAFPSILCFTAALLPVRCTLTVEPRYNKPLYNKVLCITNCFLYPSNSKICGKGPGYKEKSS